MFCTIFDNQEVKSLRRIQNDDNSHCRKMIGHYYLKENELTIRLFTLDFYEVIVDSALGLEISIS